jgi:hypothetical protein
MEDPAVAEGLCQPGTSRHPDHWPPDVGERDVYARRAHRVDELGQHLGARDVESLVCADVDHQRGRWQITRPDECLDAVSNRRGVRVEERSLEPEHEQAGDRVVVRVPSEVAVCQPDVFDDGPAKPVRIWSRVGRRPILAGGNSNGDIPMPTTPAARACACWCCTTTPSASSTTSRAPRLHLSVRPRTAGLWSASRTTGPRSAPTRGAGRARRAYSRAIIAAAARSRST